MPNVAIPVNRGYAEATDSSSDLVVTLGQALTAGRMSFAIVQFGRDDSVTPTAPSSVTGGGVTWTLHDTYSWDAAGTNRSIAWIYRALAATPSGTTVTVVPGQTCASLQCVVVEVADVLTTGTNGADCTVVGGGGKATAGTANLIAVAVPTLAAASNAWLAIAVCSNGTAARTWTPDADPAMTEILDEATTVSAGAKYRGLHVSYRVQGAETNPTIGATTSASIDLNGMWVLELASAPDGPTVTSLDVEEGTADGGTAVTITGTGFDDTGGASEGVTFGGTAATSVVFVNSTTITCVTPAHAAGLVDVVVTNGDATTDTLTDGFLFGDVSITQPGATNGAGAASGTLTSTLYALSGLAKRAVLTTVVDGVTLEAKRGIKLTEPA